MVELDQSYEIRVCLSIGRAITWLWNTALLHILLIIVVGGAVWWNPKALPPALVFDTASRQRRCPTAKISCSEATVQATQIEIPESIDRQLTRPAHTKFVNRFRQTIPVDQQRTTLVVVADTGVDLLHPDIKPFLWKNEAEAVCPNDGIDNDNNGCIDDMYGCNLLPMSITAENIGIGDGMDDNGHGSHVAGIILGKGSNSLLLPPDTKIRIAPVKMLNSNGVGTIEQAVASIKYAIWLRNTTKLGVVINASWVTSNWSQELRDTIVEAGKFGVIVVAAAGNNYGSCVMYPAAFPLINVISVGALDIKGEHLAAFSNVGADVAALGEDIRSCWINGGKEKKSGTSMAAPQVTQVIAIMLSNHPDTQPFTVRSTILRACDKEKRLNAPLAAEAQP